MEEVAHLELGEERLVRQLVPLLETLPLLSAWRQPRPEANQRLVVLALVLKKLVEVALVEVALVVVASVTVKLVIWTKVGKESVQVRSLLKSCDPADEVICPAVPAMVIARVVAVYEVVSTERVPLAPLVLTKPSEVRFEILPRVRAPMLAVVLKRLVEEATVAKLLVEVAPPEAKILPATLNAWLGVEEPIPTKPLALMVMAAIEEVAKVEALEVAR